MSGSVSAPIRVLTAARAIDPSVRLRDVREWMKRHRERLAGGGDGAVLHGLPWRQKLERGADQGGCISLRLVAHHLRHSLRRIGRTIAKVRQRRQRIGRG